jgi:hypothetical protein
LCKCQRSSFSNSFYQRRNELPFFRHSTIWGKICHRLTKLNGELISQNWGDSLQWMPHSSQRNPRMLDQNNHQAKDHHRDCCKGFYSLGNLCYPPSIVIQKV